MEKAAYGTLPEACSTLSEKTLKDLVPDADSLKGKTGKSDDTASRATCSWNSLDTKGVDGSQFRWLHVSLMRFDSDEALGSGAERAEKYYAKQIADAKATEDAKEVAAEPVSGTGDAATVVSYELKKKEGTFKQQSLVTRVENVVVTVDYNGAASRARALRRPRAWSRTPPRRQGGRRGGHQGQQRGRQGLLGRGLGQGVGEGHRQEVREGRRRERQPGRGPRQVLTDSASSRFLRGARSPSGGRAPARSEARGALRRAPVAPGLDPAARGDQGQQRSQGELEGAAGHQQALGPGAPAAQATRQPMLTAAQTTVATAIRPVGFGYSTRLTMSQATPTTSARVRAKGSSSRTTETTVSAAKESACPRTCRRARW
ncbi:hypothetical protein ACFQVA_16585 [Actinomadura keratinilytica]